MSHTSGKSQQEAHGGAFKTFLLVSEIAESLDCKEPLQDVSTSLYPLGQRYSTDTLSWFLSLL